MARNIQALLERRHAEEKSRRSQDRLSDKVTAFTGSIAFVGIHLVVYGLWIVVNLGWLTRFHVRLFDPSFVILAMEASIEAIFLSTFALISQNRMTALSDNRADPELAELAQDVAPERVLDEMEANAQSFSGNSSWNLGRRPNFGK